MDRTFLRLPFIFIDDHFSNFNVHSADFDIVLIMFLSSRSLLVGFLLQENRLRDSPKRFSRLFWR